MENSGQNVTDGFTRRDLLPDHPLDNENRSPIAEYTSISHVYEPLNKLLNMLLPHLKFEKVDLTDQCKHTEVYSYSCTY